MKLYELNSVTVFPVTMAARGMGVNDVPWLTNHGPNAIQSVDMSFLVESVNGKERHFSFDVAKMSESEARAEFEKQLLEEA